MLILVWKSKVMIWFRFHSLYLITLVNGHGMSLKAWLRNPGFGEPLSPHFSVSEKCFFCGAFALLVHSETEWSFLEMGKLKTSKIWLNRALSFKDINVVLTRNKKKKIILKLNLFSLTKHPCDSWTIPILCILLEKNLFIEVQYTYIIYYLNISSIQFSDNKHVSVLFFPFTPLQSL